MTQLRGEHLQMLKQLKDEHETAQGKLAEELMASNDLALSQKEAQYEAALEVCACVGQKLWCILAPDGVVPVHLVCECRSNHVFLHEKPY